MIRQKQRYFCRHCNIFFISEADNNVSGKPAVPTITDIAKELGFSISTVSKALHNHADISNEKKALVHAKAAELDYRPNTHAASLRKQKTMTIGIIVPEFTQSFYPKIILEINNLLTLHDYTLIILQSNNSPDNELKNINTLLDNKVDGIIGSVTFKTSILSGFQKIIGHRVPLVMFSRYPSGLVCPHIKVNDFLGAYQVVKHLIQKGYKKIGYIGGPDHISLCNDRYTGYLKALNEYDLETAESWIVQQSDVIENAQVYAARLLQQKNRPDAIFAFTDPVAIGVIEAARKLAINIPGELGLTGFSDDPISKYIQPGITTMRQPLALIAEKIVTNLIDLITNGYQSQHFPEELELAVLVERESSNKPSV
ncbi:MAG: LacI family DNA-binding transcriptional regulator [Sediminibacterium sp.]